MQKCQCKRQGHKVRHSTGPKSRHLLKSMDDLFNLEALLYKMFHDFVPRLLVLDPAHALFVNGSTVPLQRVVIVIGGGFQLLFQQRIKTDVLVLSCSSRKCSMLTCTVIFLTPSPVLGNRGRRDVVVIEVVILTGWVDDAALDLSEPLKSNSDGDLGLGWRLPRSSYALG